ncbi:hypothetical protein PoB_006648200 [Plakobranchus ocellatus]|uniref:Uncharacterized protein n=1 Tax=Plakobranchus ocellatus TaxID=259542 RepID=A0AAV4D6X1_9GAST|nr:hypothetical protein PoB_006648200 [Plakobranchus ocellatus]
MIEIIKPPTDFRSYRVVILPNGISAMLISERLESDDSTEWMDVDDELQEVCIAFISLPSCLHGKRDSNNLIHFSTGRLVLQMT